MKEIKIRSIGLSISVTIISGLSLFSWYAGKHFKGLSAIVFFSSSTAGLVAAAKSMMDEGDVNEKIKRLVENNEKELSTSKELSNQLTGIVAKLDLELKSVEKALDDTLKELQTTLVQLQMAKDAFNLKCQELAKSKGTKDTRFSHFLKEYTTKMGLLLIDSINHVYGSLLGKCDALLKRPEYANIHSELEKFKASLEEPIKSHIAIAKEIANYNIESVVSLIDVTQSADEITTLTIQVMEELSAHKVRYRNMLNIDERRELAKFEQMKPYLMRKQTAQEILNEQAAFGQNTLENLKARIEEHGEEIQRDRQEFMEVLKQLEVANERVASLSQPILWASATVGATWIGNVIIQFFQKQRIHLDASTWKGDKHEAVLYFQTTRINPAQRIDVKALNEHGEYLAQFCQCLKPIVFDWDYEETHMLTAKVAMMQRPEKARAKEASSEAVKNPLGFLKPSESLLAFVRDAYHVGLWGETGTGKSTAISNIIGGMVQELGGLPDIRATIPKIDADTAKMFPQVDWLGVRNSVFGLLEAALEIQYRIYLNEQAFLKGEEIRDFDPILFFIDEINMIFTRWGSINEADAENVLERFEMTLVGDRLTYFQNFMRLELMNYKNQFAKRLVLFIWQTGRSLRVKSLIAGQNLKPGAFNMMKMDIANCAYIALGDAIEECKEYKVRSVDDADFDKNFEILQEQITEVANLKYAGLFCPNVGKSFFSVLPPPQTYVWSKDGIAPKESTPSVLLSLEASKVLDYFRSARSKKPKTLRDLKKADRLQNLTEGALGVWSKVVGRR